VDNQADFFVEFGLEDSIPVTISTVEQTLPRKAKDLAGVDNQTDFFVEFDLDDSVLEDSILVTISTVEQTLPPSLGGGVRYLTLINSGWWLGYGETPEASKKTAINNLKNEIEAYQRCQ